MPTRTTAHVPPHSIEAERSVLGAILLCGAQALEPIAHEESLGPDDFYRERHALVYEAMVALHQRREPIDTLTVTTQLSTHGVLEQAGGDLAVDELAGWVPAAGHGRAYARIVRDLATRRRVLRACYEIEQHALEGGGGVDELLADASKRIGDLLEDSVPAGARQMHELLFDRAAELHRLAREPAAIGLQTGIARVDEALNGMRAGELLILAARPSQGKSVLAQQIATHNALQGNGTILFSPRIRNSRGDQRLSHRRHVDTPTAARSNSAANARGLTTRTPKRGNTAHRRGRGTVLAVAGATVCAMTRPAPTPEAVMLSRHADRHLSAHARVPYGKIRAASFADPDLERIAGEATGWARDTPPLVACDRAPLTIADLRSGR